MEGGGENNQVLSPFPIGDPDELDATASKEERVEWFAQLVKYAKDMFASFELSHLTGEELWLDFIVTFRPHSVMLLPQRMVKEWIDLLTKRGVWIKRARGFSKTQCLLECLNQRTFIAATADNSPWLIVELEAQKEHDLSGGDCTLDAGTQVSFRGYPGTVPSPDQAYATPTALRQRCFQRDRSANDSPSPSTESAPRSSGISGLMKAYTGRSRFSGGFDEDLNSALELYETLSSMCHLSNTQKAEGLPIMLKDDALSFYMTTYKPGESYESICQKFTDNYLTAEQRNRALIQWQSLRLTKAMKEAPDKSELQVFRFLVTKLSRLQRQLAESYRKDSFLRDQIVLAADTPRVQQSMRERIPDKSADATNRIATFLSSEPKSAGAYVSTLEPDGAHYTTGFKYGGGAQKALKGTRSNTRKISRWLAGHKGCFVCNKDHRARSFHTRAEVSEAIQRLKKKYPQALVAVSDFALLVQDLVTGFENCPTHESDHIADDSSSSSDDEINLANDELDSDKSAEVYLANVSFLHGRTYSMDLRNELSVMYSSLSDDCKVQFKGLYIDTCANRSSVMSEDQYKAYCIIFKVPLRISKTNRRNLKGIGGSSSALGSAQIPVPVHELKLVIDVTFQIIQDDIPSLLCMKDMIDNCLDISILKRTVSYKDRTQSLHMENYFLIHKWKPSDTLFCLYTETELRKLHRTFGHPSVTALTNVLRRARPSEMTNEVKSTIEAITKACTHCALHSGPPKRFKLTVGTDDLRFNHIVAVDIMYIQSRPVLHIVDEATHYNAACFLTKVSTAKVWKSILSCWSRVYLGPPDHLRVDQGSQFISKEFLENAEADGITVLPVPVESPSTMSHVERYHGPLRMAYLKIRDELPRSETDQECLQMAVKYVNDTIGTEGLCPTILVYRALPRPARRTPAETQLARATAIEKAMKVVTQEQAKRRVSFGLKTVGGPYGHESSEKLRNLPAGSPVYVYRRKSKSWEGPFTFIQIDGETVIIQNMSGRKIFRSHAVKPVIPSEMRSVAQTKPETVQGESSSTFACCSDIPPEAPSKAYAALTMRPTAMHTFQKARQKELKGLLDRNTFSIVKLSNIPKGTRIYGTRWVDTLKTENGVTFEKSRLVAQNYRDKGATHIATRSPTVSRLGQRLIVALATAFGEKQSYVRDISQAYVQSASALDRPIYLRPPKEMNVENGCVLKALKPLYGIPESGLHWYVTYLGHHVDTLGMEQTTFDPCILFKRDENGLQGVTALQVDDSYGFGTQAFLHLEDTESRRFKSKPRTILKKGKSIEFNGTRISAELDNSYVIHQSEKLTSLKHVKCEEDFVTVRAQAQYIGGCTRPDICSPVQLLASSVGHVTSADMMTLNVVVKRCKETNKTGLRYIPLDTDSLRLVLFSDASFANARNLKSQIGFVLALADKHNNANIIHYGSARCKRVTRSVMAAEIHGLIYGFDNAFVARSMLQEILDTDVPIDGVIDSKTLFNVVAKSGSTLEKRLQIDVHALRESHEKGELRYLAWIPGSMNPADGLTKGLVKHKHPLWKLMISSKLDINPTGWVEALQNDQEFEQSSKKDRECGLVK